MSEKIKFVDLFAGIGGFRYGLIQAFGENNVECVLSSEIDKFAQKTYQANFNCANLVGDIKMIDETKIEDFDLLMAGFPCQPFSKAGKEKGFDDERGTLFFEILRILKHKKPKMILLENVKRLKNHDQGNTFNIILEKLKEVGYKIYYKILSSKDFGLPQNRERLFIVGFLDHNIHFEFPNIEAGPVQLKSIFDECVDPKYTISDKLWAGSQRRKEENKQKGRGFGYQLFTGEESYASTLTARYYKDGSDLFIQQENKNPRKLTPNEARKYQGFPDSFKFVVCDSQLYKQFGNSVSVPVIKHLCLAIKKSLENKR